MIFFVLPIIKFPITTSTMGNLNLHSQSVGNTLGSREKLSLIPFKVRNWSASVPGTVTTPLPHLNCCFLLPSCLSCASLEIVCHRPQIPKGDLAPEFQQFYTYRDALEIGCKKGFVLRGSSVIHCEANGEWYPSIPTCEPSEYRR